MHPTMKGDPMQTSKLFALLPPSCNTPDGMAVGSDGCLYLAAANYADPSVPGSILRIDREKRISQWATLPTHPETGRVHPMGIAFAPNGDLYVVDNQGWSGEETQLFKGRILRLHVADGAVREVTVVASGMEHPNGLRIRDGYAYVTQSMLSRVQDPSGKLVSCVYRFQLEDREVAVTNTLSDPNLLVTFLTLNPECQYGADGIEFDDAGNLYVGNFGDGAFHRVTFHPDGSVKENLVWAKDTAQLQTTDGIIRDSETGNFYVADFSANAIAKVTPDGHVTRIAQSPDTDGLNGELDQPGEPCIWQGQLIVSCFDLVTGPDKVNTAHEMPATLACLALEA
jgi:sugar lactone lactonase YvrE